MPNQVEDTLDNESSGGVPFGGTISSLFLMATLSLGVYLLYESATNDFVPMWKAAYWVATIVSLTVSLAWTISLCGRYGLSLGHMFGGVVLSSLAVICLVLLVWINHHAQGAPGNGEVLVAVLAAIFGIAALGMSVIKTNVVFGLFLTAVQLAFSLVLLLLLVLFGAMMSRNDR
ncbi:hypothetical protein EN851_20210 [Mesorhizobium sp. M8A.F.Ca.ET.208.01.1.1]|uniref:hypothetical protein n=1 Tax=unclassified Mesorhizobium TaxID=325217 RepID=UPI001093E081|nr:MULTISPECIES: hypothetical protein [unclassified Mesorhizobium]TGQ89963.1 hypothetical protein EN851_20210 [Mesorhizobium sp. M8A.F.Ca.ET.208.01.1.1]TGT50802.1 hypothetical protein EN810_20110 [Mesorhizobium sp. M8A.F.Ca.ET.167.01.1.1]